MADTDRLLARAETLLERFEELLPGAGAPADWGALAYRWRRRYGRGRLEPVPHPHRMLASDLLGIERQFTLLDANTRQFVAGAPANNALLWGSRGTGKSSLIKALLTAHADAGLRLVEVDKHDLLDLPDILALLDGRPERFLLYCDDLSFEAEDPSYKALKALLDGSISVPPDNVLIYATSNRRHLLPEFFSENLDAKVVDEEIHPGEAVEEKVSLSDRFGASTRSARHSTWRSCATGSNGSVHGPSRGTKSRPRRCAGRWRAARAAGAPRSSTPATSPGARRWPADKTATWPPRQRSWPRSSPPKGSPSSSARGRWCARSTSRSPRDSASASSARTAPARPPRCACCSACLRRVAARSPCSASRCRRLGARCAHAWAWCRRPTTSIPTSRWSRTC
jgi:predicted AAA+ superfamily ATPase